MIRIDQSTKTITAVTNTLIFTIHYDGRICFDLNNQFHPLLNTDLEAFVLQAHGRKLTSKDFLVTKVSSSSDKRYDLATLEAENKEELFRIRIHLIDDHQDSVNLLYQILDNYKFGTQTVVKMHVPLLSELSCGEGEIKHYPSCSVRGPKGTDVLVPMRETFYSTDVLMPLVVSDRDEQFGYCVEFPVESDLSDTGAVQNINKILTTISSEEELVYHNVQINPDASFNDTMELKITGLKKGWPEAFERTRRVWSERYDFSEYDKPDLKWFDRCVVNNFTFLYGKEGFDLKNKKIDVEGLLKQGEAFGGYDTVTIWNMYPRLGIDSRTQWDFYDDFPGGRQAIREAVAQFHKHGVKVFLPYIPWDEGPNESTESMGDQFAKIIADTDADGFQLDTLTDLPYSFRKKLDKVKPGIILTTQHHPMKKHPTEFITTSWDEFWRTDPMPEVDVFRFICPQHKAPVISRWLRMEDKTVFIKRVEFGGATIVIWQDIFGRWMPFTEEQKARIKRWKETYLKYIDIYQCADPIPLYPTLKKDLYCNLFSGSHGDIYSFYNDSENRRQIEGIRLNREGSGAEVIYGNSAVSFDGTLNFTIEPKEVVHILVK